VPLYDPNANEPIESASTAMATIFKIITSPHTPGHVTLDDLRGQDGTSRAKVMGKIEEHWMRHIARYARTNLTTTRGFEPTRPLNATMMDYRTQWLDQNEVSARILQGLLGAAFAFLAIGLVFGDRNLDKLLPFPPISVGAILSLLDGSKILGQGGRAAEGEISEGKQTKEEKPREVAAGGRPEKTGKEPGEEITATLMTKGIIPSGAERLSDKELRAIFEAPGRVFSLKKWETAPTKNAVANGKKSSPPKRNYTYRIDFEDRPDGC